MTMVTRSGRVSKQPERFSPQERITDDYSDDDYSDYSEEDFSDDDASSAVSYSTDEGHEYVADGFVEPDDAPMDHTDDEWVPDAEEDETEDDPMEDGEETFTDDEEAIKEAEELKKNYREKETIVDGEDEEGFEDAEDEDAEDEDAEDAEDAEDSEEDGSDLIEGEEDFTDEEDYEDSDEDSEDFTEDESEESFEDTPVDPKESRKRVRKTLADKNDHSFLHDLGVDPSETRNLQGVPMLPSMALNEGFSEEPVDLTQ